MTHTLRTCKISLATALIFSLQITKSFAQNTYLSPIINGVSNNFNYGEANSTLKSYKKDAKGIMAGATFQAGITPAFSVVTETYFVMKGATLKTDNPLTVNKSTLRLYNAEIPVLAGKSSEIDPLQPDEDSTGLIPYSGTYIHIGERDYLLFNNTRYVEASKPTSREYHFPVKIKL